MTPFVTFYEIRVENLDMPFWIKFPPLSKPVCYNRIIKQKG